MIPAEKMLRALINRDKYTSISLTWNEDHSPMYQEADGYYEYDSSVWVSQDEFLKAMMENSVWTLQWYPDTPVGFHKIMASSLEAIYNWIDKHYENSKAS